MTDREKVMKGLKQCLMDISKDEYETQCEDCPYFDPELTVSECKQPLLYDALSLLKAQEQYHRLQVHNIGNVDIPDWMTMEQFHEFMDNVVSALEHTDRGESWPYDYKPVVGQAFNPD